ncbi:MAG: hypothetical protein LBK40_06190 [Spirochaetaceae bacterium]|jgi:hypothetical protein|nr:hypothetical protein [Spirochaetaceae bacterium]
MKKLIVFVVITFAASSAFAQDLPTHEEAARVIEGFFKCIGNGDAGGLRNYVTEEFTVAGELYITNLSEDERVVFKTYRVDISLIEETSRGNYHCVYTDNNIFYNGRGLLNCTLIRTGSALLMTY